MNKISFIVRPVRKHKNAVIIISNSFESIGCITSYFLISCQNDLHAQPLGYTLPAATTSTLGGAIVGNGLEVTAGGVISVSSSGNAGGWQRKTKACASKYRFLLSEINDKSSASDLPKKKREVSR